MSFAPTTLPELKGSAADIANGLPSSIETTKSSVSAAVTGFISGAGLLCNIVVILVICLLKDYKKTTHWYVLNLALADSIFLLMLLFNIAQNLFGEWIFGTPLCVLFQGVFYVNYYAGVLFLAAMSFDRYVAIAHPVSHNWGKLRSSTGSRLISFAVWTVAIGASAPLMAKTTVKSGVCDFSFDTLHPDCVKNEITASQCQLWLKLKYSDDITLKTAGSDNSTDEDMSSKSVEDYLYNVMEDGYEDAYASFGFISETAVPTDFTVPERDPGIDYNCQHQNNNRYFTWVVGNFVLSFVLPLSVMACCYGGILWRIQHPKVRPSGFIVGKKRNMSPVGSSGIDKKVRVTVLVISLIAVFVVCWTPFHAVVLAKIPGIQLSSERCKKLKNAALIVAYSNSLLNPIMYSFLGINFAKRLQKAGRRIFGRRYSAKRGSFRSGGKSNSGAGTKLTKASFNSEQPVNIPMHEIVAAASKSSEHGDSPNGYAMESGRIVTIANDSSANPSERLLRGTKKV